ncbi:hypothetical protein EKO27_g2183 [Xylaria grammica]|uniref:non-specific serine/threonine protein kinase n=1 Tax=Xylaria grammica TaxID=363999 RepID=A0A439DEW7_9PEZI|nr:hypothetical protein EKO27_g2183 [Xylaria grammica]
MMGSPETEDRVIEREGLPTYALVEDIGRYVAGGFHPIHLGDRLGPDERFEVRHKLGYSNVCTVWLCMDRKNERHVGIKVLQAESSTEPHPEIAVLHLFEGIDQQELQSNHIFAVNDYFWVTGPNGRHLCLVVQVLGPTISWSLRGIDLDTPDLLTDLCLQASQSLKYLHDKKICHGDFRPDHMRLQLDVDAMSAVTIYQLCGSPRVWNLQDFQEEDNSRRPRYLVEPADLADLEFKYRTGQIVIDNFSAAHREGGAIKPHIYDTHYTAPEIRFLKKSSGFASDIWSLASSIHFIRTTRSLLARLKSRSSLVSWLAWAYGPFPQRYWSAIGEHLANDSAIPVFSANTIPQKPPRTSGAKRDDGELDAYPADWGTNRCRVVAVFLGDEETPRSIGERELLQNDKDRSRYLRIKLPKNTSVWTKFQLQRKQLTDFNSLLHEDLSKECQWYLHTDTLNSRGEYILPKLPGSIDEDTLQRLDGLWTPEPARDAAAEEALESRETNADEPDKDTDKTTNSNGKRPSTEEERETQQGPNKRRKFVAEQNLRNLVERVEQDDDMTKFAYRLQPEEANQLASLLRDMLKNEPDERIDINEVLQHEWFEKGQARDGKTRHI